jgi:hypothetical protein
VLYRVATAKEGAGPKSLGRWFSNEPAQSDIQLQIDAAVKPVWPDEDGRIGEARSPAEIVMTVRVPKGTKVYQGPIAAQGLAHLGGPDKIQIYIPDIRTTPGVEILVVAPMTRDGHVQPPPTQNLGSEHDAIE